MAVHYSEILSALEHARSEHSDLAESLDLQIALTRAQAKVSVTLAERTLDWDTMAQAMDRGKPLLAVLDWHADATHLAETWVVICNTLAAHRADLADAFAQIARLPVEQITALAQTYLAGEDIANTSNDPALVYVALNHTLRPFLRAEAARWHEHIARVPWYQGVCPFCGGASDFAALEKGEARRLLCSRCDTEWKIGRVGCPFCNDGADSYFEDGSYRLYVCEQCQHYLKTLDARKLDTLPCLLVERVLTMGMDVAAREKGYLGI